MIILNIIIIIFQYRSLKISVDLQKIIIIIIIIIIIKRGRQCKAERAIYTLYISPKTPGAKSINWYFEKSGNTGYRATTERSRQLMSSKPNENEEKTN